MQSFARETTWSFIWKGIYLDCVVNDTHTHTDDICGQPTQRSNEHLETVGDSGWWLWQTNLAGWQPAAVHENITG